MKDWKRIAEAHGIPLTARELDRIAPPLAALEETLYPLIHALTPDLEPDVELHLEPGVEPAVHLEPGAELHGTEAGA